MNISVQRKMTSELSLPVAYVGQFSRDLPFATDLNYPVPCGVPVPANCNGGGASVLGRRPLHTGVRGQLFQVQSNQKTRYHGLQVVASKRFSHHLSLDGFYVFNKTPPSVQLPHQTSNPPA